MEKRGFKTETENILVSQFKKDIDNLSRRWFHYFVGFSMVAANPDWRNSFKVFFNKQGRSYSFRTKRMCEPQKMFDVNLKQSIIKVKSAGN